MQWEWGKEKRMRERLEQEGGRKWERVAGGGEEGGRDEEEEEEGKRGW